MSAIVRIGLYDLSKRFDHFDLAAIPSPSFIFSRSAFFFSRSLVVFHRCCRASRRRMFFVTAGYPRYFSHRSYKHQPAPSNSSSPSAHDVLAKGVLWWAAHHRHHHRFSDQKDDPFPTLFGFFWSISLDYFRQLRRHADRYIRRLAKFPNFAAQHYTISVPPTVLVSHCFSDLGLPLVFWGSASALAPLA